MNCTSEYLYSYLEAIHQKFLQPNINQGTTKTNNLKYPLEILLSSAKKNQEVMEILDTINSTQSEKLLSSFAKFYQRYQEMILMVSRTGIEIDLELR